ncbi:MAG: hypothetical protein COB51_02745 [Moraxellaceae bacterium]|nr:MAG: hypothetical protein COB51_02745 [Moraxellaceae bacterium]
MSLRFYVSLFALFFASFGANAAMEINPKYYGGAGLAVQKVDINGFNNGLGLELTAGADLTDKFGAEVELTFPISEPDESHGPIDLDLEVISLAFFGTAFKTIDDQFAVFAKLGLMYRSLNYDSNFSGSSTVTATADGRDWSAGVKDESDVGLSSSVGMLFSLMPKVGIRAAFTFVDKNVSYFSVGGNYRF